MIKIKLNAFEPDKGDHCASKSCIHAFSTGTLLKIINLIFPSSFIQIAEGCNTNFEGFEQRPAPKRPAPKLFFVLTTGRGSDYINRLRLVFT